MDSNIIVKLPIVRFLEYGDRAAAVSKTLSDWIRDILRKAEETPALREEFKVINAMTTQGEQWAANEPKSKVFLFRISSEEKAKFKIAAHETHLTFSAWIRIALYHHVKNNPLPETANEL